MAVIIHRYQGGSLSVRSFVVFEVKRKFWLTALALTALCGPSAIALDRAHFVELNQKAAELRKKQDWPALREVLVEMGGDIPGLTPRYMLRMASVETHLQHKTQALRWMERYAATGLTHDVAGDDDLKPLVSEPGFQKIAQQMKDRARPIQKAEAACTFPLAGIMPEDIAFEKSSGTFAVSSIQNHALYRVSLPKPEEKECSISEIPLEDSAEALAYTRRFPQTPNGTCCGLHRQPCRILSGSRRKTRAKRVFWQLTEQTEKLSSASI